MGIQLFIVAVLAVASVKGDPKITWKSPNTLGDNGGVVLYIHGNDFSADQFNQFNETKGNKVTLVNEVDSIKCDVINYFTTTTKIVCSTRARKNTDGPSTYRIVVVVDGVEASGYLDVKYSHHHMPKIRSVTPKFARTGTLVKFWGWLHTNQVDKVDVNDPDSSATSSRRISKVYLGGVPCDLNNENDTLYGEVTRHEFYCLPESKFIGPMNASVFVTEHGASTVEKWGIYVDSKDRLYQHHTYAVVSGVSPATSTIQGGALLNVTGAGFDPYPNKTQVFVGGAECKVKQVTDDWLTCITPPRDLTSPGSGEMGLLYELWEGVHFENIHEEAQWTPLTQDHEKYTSSVVTDMDQNMELSTPSVGIFSGYLHVAHDGLYTMHINAGKGYRLYLAVDGNPNNVEYHAWNAELNLVADTPVYFQIKFHALENFRFRIILKDFNAKFVYSQSAHAFNERHKVTITPEEVKETLQVTIDGDGGLAKMYLNGFSSPDVDVSDVTQVRNGLLGLTEQQCTVNGDSPKFKYRTGFEFADEPLPNVRGEIVDDVEPFCGRRVIFSNRDDTCIYRKDEAKQMDANIFPYLCFALQGNAQPTIKVRFAWHDGRRNRLDDIEFEHDQTYTNERWTYHCYDLINVAENAWIGNHGYSKGRKLEVYRVYVPKPKGPLDRVYVDEFAFSSEIVSVVQTRPSALKSAGIKISDIEVAKSSPNSTSYTIKYTTSSCTSNFPLLGFYNNAMDQAWPGSLASATSSTYNLGEGNGHISVVKTQVATGPVTGTWDLHIQGRILKDIPADVKKEKFLFMLNTLVGSSKSFKVTEKISCASSSWDIEWLKDPGRKEIITTDISKLIFSGESVSNSSARSSSGRIDHNPITPDFLTAYTYKPKVVVVVNGYTAACEGQCEVSYDDTGAPTLTSVSSTDPESSGMHTVTVIGSGFTAAETNAYTVKLGDRECTVTSVTTTEVVCTAKLSAGTYQVIVAMQPLGASTTTLTLDIPVSVTSVDPTTVGTGGGSVVTIFGKGFADMEEMEDSDVVMIGGNECKVIESTYVELKCTVPAGAAGAASIEVTFGGKSTTLSNSLTYSTALSATLTTSAPSVLSVLGGQTVTITGSNFGTQGTVKFGDSECEVENWEENTITCISPPMSPAIYPIYVTTAQGMASGSVSVSYIFSITSSSTPKGSVKGGSFLTISGQGFGSDCSLLNVKLSHGDGCEVKQCTDTSLVCQVTLLPKTHVITNEGVDSAAGVSWKPAILDIREGDSVMWMWKPKFATSTLVHNVFQTTTVVDEDFDGSGFYSGGPIASGSFKQSFHHATNIFYASNPVQNDVVLRGQINVRSPKQMVYKVILSLGDIEASYEPDDTTNSVSVSDCEDIVTSPLDNCNITTLPPPDATHLYYTTHPCYTPRVTGLVGPATDDNIPGLKGILVRSGSTLTISGSGFGTTACQHKVTVGGAICSVTSANPNQLTCDLDQIDDLISVEPFPVKVIVWNRGEAEVDIPNYSSSGQVTVVPVVTSFTPKQGSIHGGTKITITGSGLKSESGGASVSVGSAPCVVESVTATAIVCISTPHSEDSLTLSVIVGQVPAIMEVSNSDLQYTYTQAATPTVSSVTSSGSSITITGSNFGSSTIGVTIILMPEPLQRRRRRSLEAENNIEKIKAEADLESSLEAEKSMENFEEMQQDTEIIEDNSSDIDELLGLQITEDMKEYMEEIRQPVDASKRKNHHKIRTMHTNLLDEESDFWAKFTKTNAKSFDDTLRMGVWRVGGSGARLEDWKKDVVEEDQERRKKRSAEEVEYEGRREKRSSEGNTITCTPTKVTDTEIICSAPELSAGSFQITIIVEGIGNSNFETVTTSFQITSVDPLESSTNGGAIITISGSAIDPSDVSVDIGGVACELLNATMTSIICRTLPNNAGSVSITVTSGGPENTVDAGSFEYSSQKTPVLTSVNPTSTSSGASLTLSGSILMPSGDPPEVLIGGAPCILTATASATTLSCTAPDLIGGSHSVVVRDTVYGDSNILTITYDFTLTYLNPSTGGFGGAEVTVSGTGFDPNGSSIVAFCDVPCSSVITISSSEIKCTAPPMNPTNAGTTLACDVTVENPNGEVATLPSSFTYDSSITASVTSVSPSRGGTAGGTVITITGTGFASSGNQVKIGGSECVIKNQNSNSITCETNAHNGPGRFPVAVTVPAKGVATTDENGEFFYIDRWSSEFTWGDEAPPTAGQFVVIEKGQTILLDQSTEVLRMLLIKGGHVVFDDEASEELILRAEYILIVEGGSLSIGSEEQPFQGEAVIELYGSAMSVELPHYGAKVLAVREGSLDVHGVHIPITWTHLAATASPEDTSITLKLPVTWKTGDKIVIATTEFRFMENQNEVREIASVSTDKRTITLTEPLEYEHISMEQTIGGRTIETRAEVGLLSRNVKIRGAVNSDFEETIEACDENWHPDQFETQTCFNGRFGEEVGSDQFGATVMIFGKEMNKDLVHGRISYTEVTEAGQAFQLGRYPLHFHLVGNVNTSYVRGCAVHRTYNRAVTIHAADYLTVEHNVVYNNMGHAIFTEDGVEQHNIIQYNLAIYTRTSSSLLNVDITPSSYWVVNPNNIVQHNAAVGGTHFGYWYRLERHPSGPSATNSYCQNNAPMGTFRNNTAHSIGRYGLWVFSMDGYFPSASGTCKDKTPDVAAWHDFTVWRCDRGAEVVLGGALQFHNFVALDNENAGIEMVKVKGGFGVDDGPGVFNSLIIGHSALTPEGCNDKTIGIIAPKQDIFSIADTKFVNFDGNSCSALQGCSQCKPRQGGFMTQVKGLSFENSPNKMKFKWEHESIWIDADGSLTGTAENCVVPSMGILPSDSCQMDVDAFSVNSNAKGSVCSNLKFLRFNVKGPNAEPKSLQGKNLIVSNTHGNTSIPYIVKRLTTEGWMGILFTEDTYKWQFENSEQITNITYEADTRFLVAGDYYYVQHQLMQSPDGFGTVADERNSSTSMPDTNAGGIHGDYYWNSDVKTMTYLVSENKGSRRRRTIFDDRQAGTTRSINFKVYRCKYEGCVPPTVPPIPTGRPDVVHRWSERETWKLVPVGSGGHPTEDDYNLPQAGDEIIIPAGMWVIVDTPTPSLGRVYVYGAIEFENTMDHIFNASIIFIQGGKVVAGFSKTDPFNSKLNIVLRGSLDPNNPDNVDMPLRSATPNLGWKALGVFGQLQLHGQTLGKTWVKLGATAAPQATQLTLAEAVDSTWLDKKVVITSTSKETMETEIRTVTAVSGTTITLDSPLDYEHLGTSHTLTGLSDPVKLAGEVGLLTRNIVVEGNVYPGFEKKLGGRVLVSTLNRDGLEYKGSAQLSGVEFRNMGQLGFDDTDDPRFSLAFHSLGTDTEGDNYVSKCSFNTNYNTAIGMFQTGNVLVEDNVVYHTVGPGILDESEGNMYRGNLVSFMLFPGTFNGAKEKQNMHWYGGFEINKATGVVLEGNVVAGSQQAGIRTYGEDCNTPTRWSNNEVHSAIFGVMVWKKTGSYAGECKRIGNVYAWRIEDTAFYMQHYASLQVVDVLSVDNKLGVNQLSYTPSPLNHVYEHKTAIIANSTFVGATPSHNCPFHMSSSEFIIYYEKKKFWSGGKNNGNTGVLFGSFASGLNMAPKSKFDAVTSYPALGGGTFIENVKFSSFKKRSSCGTDVALMTNKNSDDVVHPVFTSGLSFFDTVEDNKVFFHRADVEKVDPSDCVDMDCDGHKKVIVQDMDGSFLGTINSTLTSEAEHEWDGDRSHGVGDYRIPVALKQNLNGTQISESSKFPNKGIVRNSDCAKKSAWQGWQCSSLAHRMLIIESMDSDTEIRRLSPIALIADPGSNGYVDLVNGPMDRGWCFGYTCQERISTFYTVVASQYVYEVAMTSTPPQHIRLRLLHSDPSEVVILRLFFSKTQRYDVYNGETYVLPTNIDDTKAGYQLHPENSQYEPKLTDPSGSNYLERSKKLLHIVIRGGDEIHIKTTPLIILTTGIVVDSDEFFEANIVQNLADLLGVSSENIRVANIVRETSGGRRKKRSTSTWNVEFEIGSSPTTTLSGNDTASGGKVLTLEDLDDGQANLVNYFQTGQSEDANFTLSGLKIEEPLAAPAIPGPKATPEEGQVVTEGEPYSVVQQQQEQEMITKSLSGVDYQQPSGSTLEAGVPAQVVTFTMFDPYPSISVQDGNGDTIQSLGHSSDPWMFTAFLLNGPAGGNLLGMNPVPFVDGRANFTQLLVDMPGDGYDITFKLTHPTPIEALTINLNLPFSAVQRNISQVMIRPTGDLYSGKTFTIALKLKDTDTGQFLDPIEVMNQTMDGSLELVSDNGAQLSGDISYSEVGGSIADLLLTLSVDEPGHAYRIKASSSVLPAGWTLTALSNKFSVFPNGTENLASLTCVAKLRARRLKKLRQYKEQFAENVLEKLATDVSNNVFWGPAEVVVHRRKLYFQGRGTQADLEAALSTLCELVRSRNGFAANYVGTKRRKFMFRTVKNVKRRRPSRSCRHR